jgi:hypothetical protein
VNRALYRAVLVIILLAGGAGGATGQEIRSPYRFIDTKQFAGAYGGYVFTSPGRLETGPLDAPTVGVRWGMHVSGPFLLIADVGYMPSTRAVRDTVFLSPDSVYRQVGEADIGVVTALAGLRFNVTGQRTWNRLQPYAEFAGGAAIDIAGDQPADSLVAATGRFDFGTSFAAHAGLGIEWYASSSISARLDARSVFWKLKAPDLFRQSLRGALFPASEWERNMMLSAGLSFHF